MGTKRQTLNAFSRKYQFDGNLTTDYSAVAGELRCWGEAQVPRWPLWSILWRLLVFGPILLPIGLLMFFLLIASAAAPLGYGVGLVIEGRYLMGGFVLVLLSMWLYFGRRFYAWMLEGWQYW